MIFILAGGAELTKKFAIGKNSNELSTFRFKRGFFFSGSLAFYCCTTVTGRTDARSADNSFIYILLLALAFLISSSAFITASMLLENS